MNYKPSKELDKKVVNTSFERQVNEKIITYIVNTVNFHPVPTDQMIAEGKMFAEELFKIYQKEEVKNNIMTFFLWDHLQEIATSEDEFTFLCNLLQTGYKVFKSSDFENNPYYKNIKIEPQTKGRFSLDYDCYQPYELFMYDVPKKAKNLAIDIPMIGCFEDTFIYPNIKENDQVWMSITPNEIFTMEQPIRKARGKILTLGCGMGYFAYMASLKPEVESVTIVEYSQDVIDMFEECILPQFETKDKIHIVKADAIEYLENVEDGEFNYCFADIWISSLDLNSYFAVKEIGRNFKRTVIDYWIEESIVRNLTSWVYGELTASFMRTHKGLGQDLSNLSSYLGEFTYVKKLLETKRVSSPADINEIMSPEFLIKQIDKTRLKFEDFVGGSTD